MSDGNRSDKPKARRVALGLVSAAAFCAVCLGYGLSESAKYERQAHDKAAEYASYTREKVAQTCVGIAPRERVMCVDEAIDAQRDYERNEADLVAQRQSALWAYIMAAAAIIGMVLSAVGIWLVWGTYKQAADAAESAKKTLDSYIHRERAILRLGNARFQFLKDVPIPAGFQAEVLNFGASPADFVSVAWEYLDSPYWPESRKLRYEAWPDNISTPGVPAATPHLGAEEIPDRKIWLVVALTYRALERNFETFRSYEIGYSAGDEYGEGSGYFAAPKTVRGQPKNT